ncbi:THUMP domain-containing protein 3 [Planoprotostelium fungivorum]|uniref:THUMP domain-containing protein 3 n=1 Tax=Planoprotostelium fungivorum TaxID=1890364 RepID=A0A2P6NNM8_9EUKA|nr:THUMP domain-containing protein 3 [Planoprotostelium fungivorum]
MATVTSGLEHIAAAEIGDAFLGSQVEVQYDRKDYPGRVFFSVSNMTEDSFSILNGLHSVEYVYCLIGRITLQSCCPPPAQPTTTTDDTEQLKSSLQEKEGQEKQSDEGEKVAEKKEEHKKRKKAREDDKRRKKKKTEVDPQLKEKALAEIASAVSIYNETDWETAYGVWKSYARAVKGIRNSEMLSTAIFSVSARTAGSHLFRENEMGETLAASIQTLYPRWRQQCRNSEMEIMAYLRNSELILGFTITQSSLSMSHVSASRDLGVTALKPAIAYAMLRMAQLRPGMIVVDPMSGCGTIPQMGSNIWSHCLYFAGDISEVAVRKTKNNEDSAREEKRRTAPCDVFQWDGTLTPFRDNSVDMVITDMPFGKRIGNKQGNTKLYPRIFQEMYRIVREGGKAVVLTQETELMQSKIISRKTWKDEEHMDINQGGMKTRIYVLSKVNASEEVQDK